MLSETASFLRKYILRSNLSKKLHKNDNIQFLNTWLVFMFPDFVKLCLQGISVSVYLNVSASVINKPNPRHSSNYHHDHASCFRSQFCPPLYSSIYIRRNTNISLKGWFLFADVHMNILTCSLPPESMLQHFVQFMVKINARLCMVQTDRQIKLQNCN